MAYLQRVEVVRTHSATALTNALHYEGLFLMPLWRFLGKGTKLFRGRTLPKTLAVIALIVGALSFLCFYPAELKLEGEGHLRPKIRKNVWAEVEGEVQQVNVEHDSKVKQERSRDRPAQPGIGNQNRRRGRRSFTRTKPSWNLPDRSYSTTRISTIQTAAKRKAM